MNECMREDAIMLCRMINHNADEAEVKMYIKIFCDRCKKLQNKCINVA